MAKLICIRFSKTCNLVVVVVVSVVCFLGVNSKYLLFFWLLFAPTPVKKIKSHVGYSVNQPFSAGNCGPENQNNLHKRKETLDAFMQPH